MCSRFATGVARLGKVKIFWYIEVKKLLTNGSFSNGTISFKIWMTIFEF